MSRKISEKTDRETGKTGKEGQKGKTGKLAVIRIRGKTDMQKSMAAALAAANLKSVNNCILLEDNPTSSGIIQKINNHVTWGEIDPETEKLLQEKRGKSGEVFKLSPPRRGFGHGGVRTNFKEGGALGYRGKEINELLRRMI